MVGKSLNNTQLLPSQGPSAHLHKPRVGTEAQRQAGTQIKDPEEATPCPGPAPGCPRGASAPAPGVTPISMGHQEQLSRSPLGLREVTAQGHATHDGCRAVQDLLWDVQGRNQRKGKGEIVVVWALLVGVWDSLEESVQQRQSYQKGFCSSGGGC